MSINDFFNITSHLLNDTQRDEITVLYNNIKTFNYSDIFGDDDLPLTEITVKTANTRVSMIKPKQHTITKAIINNDTLNKFYKIFCFENDNNIKDLFILNSLKEVYFQNLMTNYISSNNITDFNVPTIYRYGLINNNPTELTFFIEMDKYDILPTPDFTVNKHLNQIQDLIDYYTKFRDIRVIIDNIETVTVWHNDIPNIDRMNGNIDDLNDIKTQIDNGEPIHYEGKMELDEENLVEYFFEREQCSNIELLKDGGWLLIDFEHSSLLHSRLLTPYTREKSHKVLSLIMDFMENKL
jgi:hypothetical protein